MEYHWLESIVKNLATKDGIPLPKLATVPNKTPNAFVLATVPNKTPNAFVFGRTSKSATLAVHEGLLTNLNKEEVEGEDYIVMTVLSALPLIAYIAAQTLFRVGMYSSFSNRKNKEGNSGLALVVLGAISFLVYIITFLSVMRLSRLREHYADAYSSTQVRAFYIGDPTMAKQEIQTLMKNKQEYDLDKDGILDQVELQRAMQKEAKSTWNSLNNWFSTHPPTFKRIMLLREIEKEMDTGRYSHKNIYSKI